MHLQTSKISHTAIKLQLETDTCTWFSLPRRWYDVISIFDILIYVFNTFISSLIISKTLQTWSNFYIMEQSASTCAPLLCTCSFSTTLSDQLSRCLSKIKQTINEIGTFLNKLCNNQHRSIFTLDVHKIDFCPQILLWQSLSDSWIEGGIFHLMSSCVYFIEYQLLHY